MFYVNGVFQVLPFSEPNVVAHKHNKLIIMDSLPVLLLVAEDLLAYQ